MPAAAVTPAPIAYIKVVAVKKLVVGYLAQIPSPPPFGGVRLVLFAPSFWIFVHLRTEVWIFYFEKIRVFKAGVLHLNTLAWNNEIGLLVLFCWFLEPK